MTRFYYVTKKAEDLRTGNMFVDWAIPKKAPNVFGDPHRILDIKEKDGILTLVLDNMAKFRIHPQHQVIVREMG